jgi:hypothetical protein
VRDTIRKQFNLIELREICFDLGIPWEDLGGDTMQQKSLDLMAWVERRGSEQRLIDAVEAARPGAFPPAPPVSSPPSPAPPLTTLTDPFEGIQFNVAYALSEFRMRLEAQAPYLVRILDRREQQLAAAQALGPGGVAQTRNTIVELNKLTFMHLGQTLPELSGETTGHYRRGPLGQLGDEADTLFDEPSGTARTQAMEELVKRMKYAAGFTAPSDMRGSLQYELPTTAPGQALAMIAWLETFPDPHGVDPLIQLIESNGQPFNTFHATQALTGIVSRARLDPPTLTRIRDVATYAAGQSGSDSQRVTRLRDLETAATKALTSAQQPIIAVAELEAYTKHGAWPTGVNPGVVLGTLKYALIAALKKHVRVNGQPVHVVEAEYMAFDERPDTLLLGEVNVYTANGGTKLHLRFIGPDYGGEPADEVLGDIGGPSLQAELENIALETVRRIAPGLYKLTNPTFVP